MPHNCRRLYSLLSLTLCLSTLWSCAYQPYSNSSVSSQGQNDSENISQNSAVLSLIENAESNIASGNYNQAEANIERALRIEPTNAVLWFRLAQIAQDQSQSNEARNLAERALGYTPSNSNLHSQISKFLETL